MVQSKGFVNLTHQGMPCTIGLSKLNKKCEVDLVIVHGRGGHGGQNWSGSGRPTT